MTTRTIDTNLSEAEVERRLNLCPDCLQYDGYHGPNCENEENVEPGRWEQLRRAVLNRLPEGSEVEVSEWVGCDEDWSDPVYVIGRDPDDERYIDAICDLDAASVEDQAVYVVDQLIHG